VRQSSQPAQQTATRVAGFTRPFPLAVAVFANFGIRERMFMTAVLRAKNFAARLIPLRFG
jgi:hypothetical protein